VRALIPVSAVTFVTVDEQRGAMEHAVGWFASDELRDALEAPAGQAIDPRQRRLVEAALERGRALVLARVDEWEAAADLRAAALERLGPERGEEAWRSLRGASLIACPVRSEIGRALGVLLVASREGARPIGSGQLRAVEVVADLAALALDRDTLLEAEARRAREEARLTRAAEAVAGSLELDQVYERVVQHAAAVTGATRALLTRINSRTGELRTEAQVDFSEELASRLLSLDSSSFGHLARTREPVLHESFEEKGIGSLMHAPIELGPRLYGVLSVAHEERGRFATEDLGRLVKLARSSAAAIANAIDYQRERRIARALTLGFVPESLPELQGYETGLLYAPAEHEPAGGDVYGAWRVGGGDEMALLVGDVAGKGVETAALSAMARFFIEARSWDTPDPGEVLAQANRMLLGRLPQDTFVTAFLGILSADSLRYSNAGHLAPLLVRGETVRPLDSHGLPLGVDPVDRYDEGVLALEPGDLVFAYTDGLVEARRAGEIYGGGRLMRFLGRRAPALGPNDLVRAVQEDVADFADGLADDTVALALRRSG
jgi:GAF domain-containing protein